MEAVLCYITAGSMAEARKISKALVEARLAACVNIIGKIESEFTWKGKHDCTNEVALIAKTKKLLVGELTKKIKELHSYDNPCVLAIPIVGGSKEFIEWISKETK